MQDNQAISSDLARIAQFTVDSEMVDIFKAMMPDDMEIVSMVPILIREQFFVIVRHIKFAVVYYGIPPVLQPKIKELNDTGGKFGYEIEWDRTFKTRKNLDDIPLDHIFFCNPIRLTFN